MERHAAGILHARRKRLTGRLGLCRWLRSGLLLLEARLLLTLAHLLEHGTTFRTEQVFRAYTRQGVSAAARIRGWSRLLGDRGLRYRNVDHRRQLRARRGAWVD